MQHIVQVHLQQLKLVFFRFTPSHTEIQSVLIGEARLLLYQMLVLFPDQLLAKDFKAPKNHIL